MKFNSDFEDLMFLNLRNFKTNDSGCVSGIICMTQLAVLFIIVISHVFNFAFACFVLSSL